LALTLPVGVQGNGETTRRLNRKRISREKKKNLIHVATRKTFTGGRSPFGKNLDSQKSSLKSKMEIWKRWKKRKVEKGKKFFRRTEDRNDCGQKGKKEDEPGKRGGVLELRALTKNEGTIRRGKDKTPIKGERGKTGLA